MSKAEDCGFESHLTTHKGAKSLKAKLKRLCIALCKEIGWLGDIIWSGEKGPGMEANDLVKN